MFHLNSSLSPASRTLLGQAGWRPDRKGKARESRAALQRAGLPTIPDGCEFVESFGGIQLRGSTFNVPEAISVFQDSAVWGQPFDKIQTSLGHGDLMLVGAKYAANYAYEWFYFAVNGLRFVEVIDASWADHLGLFLFPSPEQFLDHICGIESSFERFVIDFRNYDVVYEPDYPRYQRARHQDDLQHKKLEALGNAGWHKGRHVALEELSGDYSKRGVALETSSEATITFLEEFYGLEIGEWSIQAESWAKAGQTESELFQDLIQRLDWIPLGVSRENPAMLFALPSDEFAVMYCWQDIRLFSNRVDFESFLVCCGCACKDFVIDRSTLKLLPD